ncbi:hypothetical protein [Nostoc sp.]|uniref:hypothetical protein n=1 Tax=Nostoc sp. TaxID=1180 RepID=UPI002FF7BDDB
MRWLKRLLYSDSDRSKFKEETPSDTKQSLKVGIAPTGPELKTLSLSILKL